MTWKIFIKVFIKCRIDLKSFLIILLVVFQNCKKSSKILIFPQNIEFQNTIYKKKSYFVLRKFYEKTKDFSFSFLDMNFDSSDFSDKVAAFNVKYLSIKMYL